MCVCACAHATDPHVVCSKTVMVATVSPALDNFAETLSTLKYADRAKQIVNHGSCDVFLHSAVHGSCNVFLHSAVHGSCAVYLHSAVHGSCNVCMHSAVHGLCDVCMHLTHIRTRE